MAQIDKVIIILILLASLFGLNGCTNVENAAPSTTIPAEPPSQPPNTTTIPADFDITTGTSMPAIPVYLSFPNGAPLLNQGAELRITIVVPGSEKVTVITNLPDGLILVSGSLSEQFEKTVAGDIKELKAIVKPVKVGNYTIDSTLSFISWDPTFVPKINHNYVYLSVSENSSEWGRSRLWIPSGPTPITPF
jgi:hypothetical protein